MVYTYAVVNTLYIVYPPFIYDRKETCISFDIAIDTCRKYVKGIYLHIHMYIYAYTHTHTYIYIYDPLLSEKFH